MAAYIDAISARLANLGSAAQRRATTTLDRIIPPKQRAEMWSHAASFADRHPLLALLLAAYVATLVPPLLLFALFSATLLVSFVAIAVLFALGAAGVLLALVSFFVLAPALLVAFFGGTALFFTAVITSLAYKRIYPDAPTTTSSTAGLVHTSTAKISAATWEAGTLAKNTSADMARKVPSQVSSILSSKSIAQDPSRPAQPERTNSEQRELLARHALGIPPGVPITTSPEAAVAAAAERQRLAGFGHSTLEDQPRMKLEDQIKMGEELARRALEGRIGVTAHS